MLLRRPPAPISVWLVLTILLHKGPATLVKLQSEATMDLCMQPLPPTPQDEVVSEVARAAPKTIPRASELARLTHLLCPLLLLLAKTQAGRSLYLLKCPALFQGSLTS